MEGSFSFFIFLKNKEKQIMEMYKWTVDTELSCLNLKARVGGGCAVCHRITEQFVLLSFSRKRNKVFTNSERIINQFLFFFNSHFKYIFHYPSFLLLLISRSFHTRKAQVYQMQCNNHVNRINGIRWRIWNINHSQGGSRLLSRLFYFLDVVGC